MGLCISTSSRFRSTRRINRAISDRLPPTERIDQGTISGRLQSTESISLDTISAASQRQRYASFCYAYRFVNNGLCATNSPHTTSIHILDDDSLLNIFYLYQPFLLGEDQDDTARLLGGNLGWVRGRWWYNLAHVCRRWKHILLGSASRLGLSLVCTNGTPVEDMLAHSPPLPLVIDYFIRHDNLSEEDEEGLILALKQHDRVFRVRLHITVTSLQRLIVAMDKDYPILEYLVIMPYMEDNSRVLIFPKHSKYHIYDTSRWMGFHFRWNFDYSRLLWVSSRSIFLWATRLPTSIQILSSSGFYSCPSSRRL